MIMSWLGFPTLASPLIGTRHIQCFLCFCCLSLAYALRVNLSVGIVAMTDKNATQSDYEDFDWDESTKSYLLSSFFWGYITTQIPGGQIAQKYGAKTILLVGVTLCSLLSLLTPVAAHLGGWKLLFALRVIQGMLQGCVHPATHNGTRGGKSTLARFVTQALNSALWLCWLLVVYCRFVCWLPGIFYISALWHCMG
ncbi:hypothetical protein DOY81_011226, partial [Sarcophaga bullata]